MTAQPEGDAAGGLRRKSLTALKAMCLDNLMSLETERIYLKDRLSRFLFVSKSWIDAYAPGLTMAEIAGKTDADFFSEEHATAAREDELRIMRTGQPMVASVERETYKDRPMARVETTKLALRDEHGQIVGTFGISRDLTKQINAERALARQARQLQAQNERLRELDRLKDEFIGAVSHELRTPLASIIGYVELLHEEGSSGPNTGRFMEVIGRNAQRLSRLIADLLFLSGIQSGTMTMEFGHTDLAEVAVGAVEEMRPEAARKQVTLTLSATPVRCVADPTRISQLLANLLSNAVKFTPPGGSIRVNAATDGQEAVLTVHDTGTGIPAGDLASIFERFFRSQAASRQAVPGTGLGLAITKAIVDAHGGTITVDSTEGVGSVFTVRLPSSPTSAWPPLSATRDGRSTRSEPPSRPTTSSPSARTAPGHSRTPG
jgi:PAS domain S-box-containing protein